MKLENLTVGQYQQLYSINCSDLDKTDKAIQSVSVVTGKTERQIEDMPVHEFNQISAAILALLSLSKLKTEPSNFLTSGKRVYQIQYILPKLRSGQYIELQHWMNGNLIDNLHLILASIANPCRKFLWLKLPGKNDSKNHARVAEDMQNVKFGEAYGCVVFFCKLFSDSIKGLEDYLSCHLKESQEKTKLVQTLTDLASVMGGYSTPKGLRTTRT